MNSLKEKWKKIGKKFFFINFLVEPPSKWEINEKKIIERKHFLRAQT